MKKYSILIFALFSLTFVRAEGSNLNQLLTEYLSIKNALVKSDADKTVNYTKQFLVSLNNLDINSLKSKEKETFEAEKATLLKASQRIIKTNDIEKQRLAFGDLSISFWKIIKTSESISKKVYYQYCPMKKMYWLSTEEEIQNPYYGSKMLTCGSVSETK